LVAVIPARGNEEADLEEAQKPPLTGDSGCDATAGKVPRRRASG
jgi:hypothetical protein